MDELTLPLTIVLFFTTLVVIILYYREISKVNEECQEAEGMVGDIVIGFGEKMQEQDNRINVVAERADRFSSEVANLLRKMDERERRLAHFTSEAEKKSQLVSKIPAQVEVMEEKIKEVVAGEETLQQRVLELEKAPERERIQISKAHMEAALAIRDKALAIRDKALKPLTYTESVILKILATEGPKTPTEIKDVIKTTRPHASRSMKKLYDEGYLERDTRKMPYVYRIKEEAREIL